MDPALLYSQSRKKNRKTSGLVRVVRDIYLSGFPHGERVVVLAVGCWVQYKYVTVQSQYHSQYHSQYLSQYHLVHRAEPQS